VSQDQTAVKAALAGDASAYEVLVQRYQQPMFRLAFRYLGDTDRARAACVEAFERAYRGLAQFDGRAQFGTWLYRIVANTCKSHLRRQTRERERFLPLEAGNAAPDSRPGPRSRLLEQETQQEVQRAIATLSPKIRSAWILFAAEGLKVAEIAQVEGCSVGAVKSRLFHARRKLQAELREYLGEVTR